MNGQQYLDFVTARRSTRQFQRRPVPRATLERIVAAAIQAPTSCNRQLWHFVIVTDAEAKVRLCAMSDAQQSYLHDAPAVVAVFYDTSLETRNPCSTAQVSVGMSIYGLLLAAEAEGVGAIYLGGIRNPKGAARALGAPPGWQNFGFVCMGFRADDPPAPGARPVEDVVSWNRFDRPLKRFHQDIRPHLWSIGQLADFRDKLLWYKGIAIDGRTLHVDPDDRFSPKFRHLVGRLGMLASARRKPVLLDVMSGNGDLVLQAINALGDRAGAVYAWDFTPGIGDYIQKRFQTIFPEPRHRYLQNSDPGHVHIPLPDGSVDLVTCYERLDQFENPAPLLAEIARVMRPGARALVAVSGRFYPHMYRYRRMRKRNYALGRNWNRGPERKYEPQQVLDHFSAAGLRVERMRGFQPIGVKAARLAEGVCRRLGFHSAADWFADLAPQIIVTAGLTRPFSSSLVYELVRD
jgi:nitroreductase/SAM-dependent methyltransferase